MVSIGTYCSSTYKPERREKGIKKKFQSESPEWLQSKTARRAPAFISSNSVTRTAFALVSPYVKNQHPSSLSQSNPALLLPWSSVASKYEPIAYTKARPRQPAYKASSVTMSSTKSYQATTTQDLRVRKILHTARLCAARLIKKCRPSSYAKSDEKNNRAKMSARWQDRNPEEFYGPFCWRRHLRQAGREERGTLASLFLNADFVKCCHENRRETGSAPRSIRSFSRRFRLSTIMEISLNTALRNNPTPHIDHRNGMTISLCVFSV